jgi:hypothetical protein
VQRIWANSAHRINDEATSGTCTGGAGRASQKYLSEIVHAKPMWIEPASLKKYGIRMGDMLEVTMYRPPLLGGKAYKNRHGLFDQEGGLAGIKDVLD